MKFLFRLYLIPCVLSLVSFFNSCTTIDLYEKHVSIPGHDWKSDFKPRFRFTIKDTTAGYQIFFIMRHDEKYSFNNIYVDITNKAPGADSSTTSRLPLTLATNDKGWLGSGMDDIYEHRIALNREEDPFIFRTPGEYEFTVAQIMREDPLRHVYSVGIRIEKIK